ncbi:unnamed protein product, partial [marine sediment metagenome]
PRNKHFVPVTLYPVYAFPHLFELNAVEERYQ